MSTKSISVLNIIPFDQQYLSNLILNELTDGDSTTYPGKLFHVLVTHTVKKFLLMLALHCNVLTESLCPLVIVSLNVNSELTQLSS